MSRIDMYLSFCIVQLLERSEWYSLGDQELQTTFGAEQFCQCPSQVRVLSASDGSGSSAASGFVCTECCPPTSVSSASTSATCSTPGAGRSRRRVLHRHPDLCAGRRALLEQMRCVSEGAAATPLRHALGQLTKRLGLERLFQRAEDALADERDCRELHAALFESPSPATVASLCNQDVASSSTSTSSTSTSTCEDRVPRQCMTLCKRTAFTGNASLLLGGTFLSPDDVCKFQWVSNLLWTYLLFC